MKYGKIEKLYTEKAKQGFCAIEDQFLNKVQITVRTIDCAAVIMKHFESGGLLLDVGSGQADSFCILARDKKYNCFCCDDFQDPWHKEVGQDVLMENIKRMGVEPCLVDNAAVKIPYADENFDGVFCCDMIEHLHHTPRFLMEEIYRVLKPRGGVVIGMPNSVNLRKRIDVLRGRTNYIALDKFWFDGLEYRDHIREYTPHEVWTILQYSGFTPLVTYMLDWQVMARLKGFPLALYRFISPVFRSARDSYLVVGVKPK